SDTSSKTPPQNGPAAAPRGIFPTSPEILRCDESHSPPLSARLRKPPPGNRPGRHKRFPSAFRRLEFASRNRSPRLLHGAGTPCGRLLASGSRFAASLRDL